jgi:hypothetical protein
VLLNPSAARRRVELAPYPEYDSMIRLREPDQCLYFEEPWLEELEPWLVELEPWLEELEPWLEEPEPWPPPWLEELDPEE